MLKTRLAAALAALYPGVGPGQTPALVMNGALVDQTGLTNAILGINPFQEAIVNTATNTTAFTLGASQISGAAQTFLILSGTLGGAAAVTLPTVASLLAALPASVINSPVGLTWQLRVINNSGGAFAWTVTTNTGWTLAGTQTVAQSTFRDYVLTITSATTATLTSVGTGTGPA